MIDHIGVRVSNIEASSRFYDAAFKALGYHRCYSGPDLVGYGPADQALFWLHRFDAASSSAHIAFAAPDRKAIEAFHAAGLTAGGGDNGGPGLRPFANRRWAARRGNDGTVNVLVPGFRLFRWDGYQYIERSTRGRNPHFLDDLELLRRPRSSLPLLWRPPPTPRSLPDVQHCRSDNASHSTKISLTSPPRAAAFIAGRRRR